MQPIPIEILNQFEAVLKKRAVPVARHADYKKWLRYFLDFRSKYQPPDSRSEQVRLFIDKLQEKNQSPEQQKQAAHALSLFFESQTRSNQMATSQVQPPDNRAMAPVLLKQSGTTAVPHAALRQPERHFRVRSTHFTSGLLSWYVQPFASP